MPGGKQNCTACQKQLRLQRNRMGIKSGGGNRLRYGELGGTHRSLSQSERQVLQVVLMAQGPHREGCEERGSCRSQTLEEVVLKSWSSQYSSQLRKSKLVQI